MKKQLKIMSLLLSLVLLLASATPFTAKANGSINMDDNAQLITPSSDAIYSIRAADAPAELCQALNAMSIATKSNTLIEVVPLSGEAGGTALEITNVTGTTIIKDLLVAPQNNGTFANLTIATPGTVSVCDSSIVYFPSYGNALIHATAIYENPSGSYIRPQSVQMTYYSDGETTVTNVDVRYICEGYVYTYPGYQPITLTDEDIYRHEIVLFKAAPVSGTLYSFSRPYSSDRVIYTGAGLTSSHHIAFSIYVDGERIDGTKRII